jgi:hypothetical protein
MRKIWYLPIGIILVLVLAGLGFVIWGSMAAQPMPEALVAMQSDNQVRVQTNAWLEFRPATGEPTSGLILYPGGRVDPRAYAPAAHALAAQGYLVVIVPMPLNLAVFGVDKASEVIPAYPAIQHWAIGGHSLGGTMAASYALHHADVIRGLVLWASYPAEGDDIWKVDVLTTSISATNDGLATPEKINRSKPQLSKDTRYVVIQGGNHAQFGWYGPQDGDKPATISREEQQRQIIAATGDLLAVLK